MNDEANKGDDNIFFASMVVLVHMEMIVVCVHVHVLFN